MITIAQIVILILVAALSFHVGRRSEEHSVLLNADNEVPRKFGDRKRFYYIVPESKYSNLKLIKKRYEDIRAKQRRSERSTYT